MKIIKEKSIQEYDKDVSRTGGYLYTAGADYSAKLATARQTQEISNLILEFVGKNKKILDVGCGDGTFTFDLYKSIKPKKIIGFDNAKEAIRVAKKKASLAKKLNIEFVHCSIYKLDNKLKKEKFDAAVIRGVLHHLYNPEKAISNICMLVNKVVVEESNGYNPLLKIIEKVSPYHRQHEEKSYFPFIINKWFKNQGFANKKMYYFLIIPYFCSNYIAKILNIIQPFFEKIPIFARIYTGHVIIYYEKNKRQN